MSKRSHYVALSVVAVLVLVLLGLPPGVSSRLKLAIGGLFLPLFGLAGSAQGFTTQISSILPSRRELAGDLEKARSENQQLRFKLQQFEEVWLENQVLRESLSWQRRVPLKMKLARVIGRDPANWWNSLQIDLGARDGIQSDMPVRTAEGLVGKVGQVGYGRSQVVAVGDSNCRVPALVVETRDSGVILPPSDGTTDRRLVDLSFLPGSSPLRPGQRVVTSGLGEIFPKDITIGRVADVRTVGYGLYAEARVRLEVDFNRIELVWVVFP